MTADARMQSVAWPVLLGAMIGCILLSAVTLVEHLISGWDGTYLVLLGGLAAFESSYARGVVRPDSVRADGGVRFRLLELILFFVLLQLFVDVTDGHAALQDGVPQVDLKTVGLFVPVLLAWLVATDAARLLRRLGEPPEHDPRYVSPRRQLAWRFLAGGVLQFVAAGLTQPQIAHAMNLPDADTPGPLLNVPLYFLLGTIMLGHIRYATLSQRWREQEMRIAVGLGSRWLWYSVAFVVPLAIMALMVPTSHAAGLLSIGRAAWDAVFEVTARSITGARRPLAQLVQLFGVPSHHVVSHLPQLPPIALQLRDHLPFIHTRLPHHLPVRQVHHAAHSAARGGSGAHLEIVETTLFWSAVAVGALYLLRASWRRHPRIRGLGGTLAAALAALRRFWSALGERVEIIRDHAALGRAPALARSMPLMGHRGAARRGALSPREQVMYYYLNIVHRAGGHGFPRRRSQTPHEFQLALAPRLSDPGEDMVRLTEAFVRARYSPHDVEALQVGHAHESWQRLRRALRAARKGLNINAQHADKDDEQTDRPVN